MTQSTINVGTIGNDGTGDSIRIAGAKVNNNFTELYATSAVQSHIGIVQNNISSTLSNADIDLKPAGTGSILFPGIRFNDNNIEAVVTDDDLKIIPNGSGYIIIDGLGFAGTSINAADSSVINVNDNLTVDGTLNSTIPVFTGAVTINSTLDVTSTTTLSTLSVSGASSFVGTTTIDNLTFNDNIISSSSNADINLTPGGTGVVNVSNLTIDSSINLTDNVIKLTRSNDDMIMSASGTGSIILSKIDIDEGTVDNTVIGATTPAASTFTTLTFSPTNTGSLSTTGLTITDNTITTTQSNDDLELEANSTGYVSLNGIKLPNADGGTGQVLKTDGSGNLSWFTSPILFSSTDFLDGTRTVTGNSLTYAIDSFSASTYRSVKYHIQISDATADRYSLIEANVTHDGTNAYLSVFGGVGNGDGDGSSVYDTLELSADIDSGNVRLLGRVNNTNNQVLKFIKKVLKV